MQSAKHKCLPSSVNYSNSFSNNPEVFFTVQNYSFFFLRSFNTFSRAHVRQPHLHTETSQLSSRIHAVGRDNGHNIATETLTDTLIWTVEIYNSIWIVDINQFI